MAFLSFLSTRRPSPFVLSNQVAAPPDSGARHWPGRRPQRQLPQAAHHLRLKSTLVTILTSLFLPNHNKMTSMVLEDLQVS
jgi:hypothetical protein